MTLTDRIRAQAPTHEEASSPTTMGYRLALLRSPKTFLFLLTEFPAALTASAILLALTATGAGTAIVYVGVPITAMALGSATLFARFTVRRLGWAGELGLASWGSPVTGTWLRRTFLDQRQWLRLVYAVVVAPLAGAISWSVTVAWSAAALAGVSYWAWSGWIPGSIDTWRPSVSLVLLIGPEPGQDLLLLDNVLYFVVGAALLVALPKMLAVLTEGHAFLARSMIRF